MCEKIVCQILLDYIPTEIVTSQRKGTVRAIRLDNIHGLQCYDAVQFAASVLRHKSILNRHISAEAERLCAGALRRT